MVTVGWEEKGFCICKLAGDVGHSGSTAWQPRRSRGAATNTVGADCNDTPQPCTVFWKRRAIYTEAVDEVGEGFYVQQRQAKRLADIKSRSKALKQPATLAGFPPSHATSPKSPSYD